MQGMWPERKLFKVHPVWNDLGRLRHERSERFQVLSRLSDPGVHSTVEEMTADGMEQMPGEDHLRPRNLPRRCTDNRIVASYVCMNNVEPFSLEPCSQPHRRDEVRG